MNRKKISFFIAILTIVISVLAALISCWAAYSTNRNTKLAYRPYVIAAPFLDQTGGKFGLYLSNPGLGPAVLKNMTVTMKGKSYSGLSRSIWPQFMSDRGIPVNCFRRGWPAVEAVLKAGEEDPILVLSGTAPSSCVGEMTKLLGGDDIRIQVEYASIYDDRYFFDGSVHFNDDDAERTAVLYLQLDTLRAKVADMQAKINALASQGVAIPAKQ